MTLEFGYTSQHEDQSLTKNRWAFVIPTINLFGFLRVSLRSLR